MLENVPKGLYPKLVMHSVGFRASPKDLACVVTGGTAARPTVVLRKTYKPPASYDSGADVIAWYMTEIGQVMSAYAPSRSAVRGIEPTARPNRSMIPRFQLEGALIALLHQNGMQPPLLILAQITKLLRLGKNAKAAKEVLAAADFRGISLIGMPDGEKEALLCALSTKDAAT
jgi:hypothetical protein